MSISNQKIVGKVNVVVEVTDYDVENIIVSSFEGGSRYWMGLNNSTSDWREKPKNVSLSMWAAKLLLEGKNIELYELELECEENQLSLDLKKLITGVSLYINNHNLLDKDQWDADTADCIMQYALFGKLVYG
ncbi:hypothetical protein LSG23_20285 (plasmid) [Bacillus velezensis]|uniref:hypothetical protein n=1 Tax=Bacillus velezensis TaxID=492670 RepID=UPI000987F1CE|nr:hypothetical protein [Bacillus velezensis]AQS42453.1 hypothetical protein BVH55_00205 [Bacillus velezensis]WNR83255.1 hypothetical protein RP314_20565 [Bacillus velezensis]